VASARFYCNFSIKRNTISRTHSVIDGRLQTLQYSSTKTPVKAVQHKLGRQFMSPSDHHFATLTSTRQQAPDKSCLAEPSSEVPLPGTSHNPGAIVVDQQQDLLQ